MGVLFRASDTSSLRAGSGSGRAALVLLVAWLAFWSEEAAARPVDDKSPLDAPASETEILVLGVDLGRFRSSPDLRRVEPEVDELVADVLQESGYVAREYDASSSDAEKGDPPFVLAGIVQRFACSDVGDKTCGIVVEWAIMDYDSGALVYRVKTSHEETELARVGKGEAARALMRGALRSLLSRKKFTLALSRPRDVFEERLPQATLRACESTKLEMPKDAERAIGATVVVRTPDGIGSAVSVSPDGYLLTAAHVVSGFEKKGVTVLPRGGKQLKARVVRYDEGSDVALLKIEAGPKIAACLDLSTIAAKAGEDVYVVGAPAGEELSFSMSRGILSGKRRLSGNEYLQTDASINPGNSGGPLLDKTASVLGIVSWKMSGQALEGLGFAVEIASALEALSLSMADASTKSLGEERARTNVFKKPVVDAADGAWTIVGQDERQASATHSRKGNSEAVGILRGAGLLAVVLGGSTVAISALANSGNTTDQGAYYTARTYNDIGWIVAGVGAAAVATSFVIPLFQKDETTGRAGTGRGAVLRAGAHGAGVHVGLEVRH